MKLAYLVLGAESSGTKMLAEFLVKGGCHGDFTHVQKLDDLAFDGLSPRIMLRRSLPHGREPKGKILWPDLHEIVGRMRAAHYGVTAVIVVRDKDCCVASQLKSGHQTDGVAARSVIREAYERIYAAVDECGLQTAVVPYEPFVKYHSVRRQFARTVGVAIPVMTFHDANAKYLGG